MPNDPTLTRLRERLTEKRANYVRSLERCNAAVKHAEQQIRAAKLALAHAREARAATQTGLQVVDETLADLGDIVLADVPSPRPVTR